MSPPVQAARIYTHHHHLLLLLSPKADTHFTVQRRVEGWVDHASYRGSRQDRINVDVTAHVVGLRDCRPLSNDDNSVRWHISSGRAGGYCQRDVTVCCCRVDSQSANRCRPAIYIQALCQSDSFIYRHNHIRVRKETVFFRGQRMSDRKKSDTRALCDGNNCHQWFSRRVTLVLAAATCRYRRKIVKLLRYKKNSINCDVAHCFLTQCFKLSSF